MTVLFFVGCANPGIVQLSPDTYVLSREDHAGIFGSASSLKAGVIQDANKFAEKMGKIAIPLSSETQPAGPGKWATFEYQFRVVDKDDAEARRTSLVPRPDLVVEKKETSEITTKNGSIDVYAELIRLDDLRKKGIITNVEFEAQKKKLLSK